MPFSQTPVGARRILGRWWWSGWLWCCGRWCSRHMTKQSSPTGSGRGRRVPVREGYKVVALLLKPSLGLFGLVGQCRVLLPHPGSATGHLITPGDQHTLQHIQVHFGVNFQADFEDVRWHDVALTWNHTKDHNCSRKLCFHHPGHVPVIRGYPAMVLAVITCVTYWPSTEPSIKRCTSVKRKQVGVRQLYNPVPQTAWGSSSSSWR